MIFTYQRILISYLDSKINFNEKEQDISINKRYKKYDLNDSKDNHLFQYNCILFFIKIKTGIY